MGSIGPRSFSLAETLVADRPRTGERRVEGADHEPTFVEGAFRASAQLEVERPAARLDGQRLVEPGDRNRASARAEDHHDGGVRSPALEPVPAGEGGALGE